MYLNTSILAWFRNSHLTPASSVHDGEIIPMLAALDIMHSTFLLPVTHLPAFRKWRISQVVPMSGRIVFERLTCYPDYINIRAPATFKSKRHKHRKSHPEFDKVPRPENGTYLRININDGPVALPGCSNSGPGSSCPLHEFLAHVRSRGEEVGDFREMYGLGPDVPGKITFSHQ